MKKLSFKFVFPPISGIYDIGNGTIYIFGEGRGIEEDIEDVLIHETLHFVIQQVAGDQACLDFDNIPSEWMNV